MAKISAHGATEVARWRHADGRQYLLRSDGVLLWKSSVKGDGWKANRRGKWTLDAMEQQARAMGYERVYGAR